METDRYRITIHFDIEAEHTRHRPPTVRVVGCHARAYALSADHDDHYDDGPSAAAYHDDDLAAASPCTFVSRFCTDPHHYARTRARSSATAGASN